MNEQNTLITTQGSETVTNNSSVIKPLQDIRLFSLETLQAELINLGEKKYRALQVYDWIWKKGAHSFQEMTNLALELRNTLAENFVLHKLKIKDCHIAKDGTIKYVFHLHDGNLVEGVLIPTSTRMTACVSSQVGCSLSCKFCATGYLPLKRNLTAYEIYDQVEIIGKEAQNRYGIPLSNIVYMGMGEPLLNYRNVLESIRLITSAEAMGMSPRRITLSTAGIAKMIKKLGDDQVKFEFALSLHAANDTKRNEIMPINETNNLEALEDALRYFYQKTGTRITYEYVVLKGFNDTLQDAQELAAFARKVPSKINLIEYNPISAALFQTATVDNMENFRAYLEQKGLIVNIRRSRGKDIDGACGQLALKHDLIAPVI